MKLFVTLLLAAVSTAGISQTNPNYDKALADRLGGNENGMKQYVLVILKTGSNTTTDKATTDKLFAGHMENIGRLAKEGKLVLAGPLGKNDKSYRGIFILNVKTIAEAEALLQTDPAIKEKLLDSESYIWWGSAAVSETVSIHDKIQMNKP